MNEFIVKVIATVAVVIALLAVAGLECYLRRPVLQDEEGDEE